MVSLLCGYFSHFLKCANGTKSRKTLQNNNGKTLSFPLRKLGKAKFISVILIHPAGTKHSFQGYIPLNVVSCSKLLWNVFEFACQNGNTGLTL